MEFPESMHHLLAEIVANERNIASERNQAFLIYGAKIMRDGDSWCALLGDDIQSGVCGFGDTPSQAVAEFDRAWYRSAKEEIARARNGGAK